MNIIKRSGRTMLTSAAGARSIYLLPVLAFLLLLALSFPHLSACAMSALIARQGFTLDDFPIQGPAAEYWAYNDPWDYFGFVMANSSEYSNADGYGVVAYRDNDPILAPRGMWYKRVYNINDFGNTYYSGHYLEHSSQSAIWDYDVLDTALFSVLSGADHPAIVLCHARNATGVTYGNHPFWFQTRGRTFTFMHNGNVNAARAYMISKVHERHPENNWFVQHPSNYFAQINPLQWVDTEVFFHYIMSYIVDTPGDVLTGLRNALGSIRPYLEDSRTGVYNFIMSDGENIYAFRSTPLAGTNSHYKLSYKDFGEQFYAIRTQSPGVGDFQFRPLELVVFSRDQKPSQYPDFPGQNNAFGSQDAAMAAFQCKPHDLTPGIVISPNPFRGSAALRFNVSSASLLKTVIYNTRGEEVWQASQDVLAPGYVTVIWSGMDNHGRKVAAGLYYISALAGNELHTGRIVFIK